MNAAKRPDQEGERLIRRLLEEKVRLAARFRVRELAVFGSYARGDQGPGSDIDLLVDVDPSLGLGFVALAEELERVLGKRVDLVSTRAIKPRMREAIERDLIRV